MNTSQIIHGEANILQIVKVKNDNEASWGTYPGACSRSFQKKNVTAKASIFLSFSLALLDFCNKHPSQHSLFAVLGELKLFRDNHFCHFSVCREERMTEKLLLAEFSKGGFSRQQHVEQQQQTRAPDCTSNPLSTHPGLWPHWSHQ